MKTKDRNLQCIFISGPSGCGKTTFAKQLAEKKGYVAYISSGGKHPLDNYAGEECIILDDIRETTYEYNDLLKLTDNHTDSLVGCRFFNKSIAECKLIIITTVIPINKFAEFWAYGEETAEQLLRRFGTYVVMGEDNIRFYHYDGDSKEYLLTTETNNCVSDMYKNKGIENEKFIISLVEELGLQQKPITS